MMIESGTSQCPRLYNVILAGPNIENFVKKFYRQWKLGTGPNIENLDPISTAMEVDWAQPANSKLETVTFNSNGTIGDRAPTRSKIDTKFSLHESTPELT
ncbi:hypothetical protein D3W98_08855 [Staphylococcus aureus subsp. aureus]|nr:hypothetical protein [Staphylococcus aureus]